MIHLSELSLHRCTQRSDDSNRDRLSESAEYFVHEIRQPVIVHIIPILVSSQFELLISIFQINNHQWESKYQALEFQFIHKPQKALI